LKKSKTNLEYLLNLCQIRGVEVAKYLHVDQSLVGKWKKGTRTLLPESGYADQLAGLFLKHGEEKIDALFKDVYKENYNKENITEHLKAFICSKDPNLIAKTLHKDLEADYTSSFYAYDGVKGRKKAMNYYMEYALGQNEALTLYFYDSTCFDWLIKDEEYFEHWGQNLVELLNRGCEVYVIVDSETKRKSAAVLLQYFYPFSVNRSFNIYYVDGISYPTFYIIGGMLAVTGYNDYLDDSMCTQVFVDYIAVRQQELYIRRLLRMRKKRSIRRLTAKDCFENINNFSVVSGDIYIFSAMPTLYSMPEDLFEKILSYNTNPDEGVKNILREYNKLTRGEFFPKNKNIKIRCIFPLEEIKRLSQQENIIYSDNLYSESAELSVKQEDYRAHLNFLINKMQECENYQIGLIPDIKGYGTEVSKFGYIACKERCWTIISNEHSGAKAMFFMDPSLTDLFFEAQHSSWENIPGAYLERNNVIHILNDIIEA